MAKEWENPEENPEEEIEEPEDDIIELVDENGETTEFELLGSFELNDQHYLAVSEPTEEEEPDSMEVFILKVVPDEEGNDTYVAVEDEEADEAFEAFLKIVEAQPEE